MTKVILDRDTQSKLRNCGQSLELCDERGRTLGYVTPASEAAAYAGVEPPCSENELERRDRQGGGRTLSEIRRDLERGS